MRKPAARKPAASRINLFRRPAGLADGLARKEPALHVIRRFAPTTWVPRPRPPARDSASGGHCTHSRGIMSSAGLRMTYSPCARRYLALTAGYEPNLNGAASAPRPLAVSVLDAPRRRPPRPALAPALRLPVGGGGSDDAPRRRSSAEQGTPVLGQRARRSTRPGARLPGLRDEEHDARRRRRSLADAAAVAQAVYPGAGRTRGQGGRARRPARLAGGHRRRPARRRADRRAGAVQRGRRAARGDDRRARHARPDRAEGGRRRAGHPHRRRARARRAEDDRRPGGRPGRQRAARSTAAAAAARKPTEAVRGRVLRPPRPRDAGRGLGGEVRRPGAVHRQGHAAARDQAGARAATSKPKIYVLGPQDVISEKVVDASCASSATSSASRAPTRSRTRSRSRAMSTARSAGA